MWFLGSNGFFFVEIIRHEMCNVISRGLTFISGRPNDRVTCVMLLVARDNDERCISSTGVFDYCSSTRPGVFTRVVDAGKLILL